MKRRKAKQFSAGPKTAEKYKAHLTHAKSNDTTASGSGDLSGTGEPTARDNYDEDFVQTSIVEAASRIDWKSGLKICLGTLGIIATIWGIMAIGFYFAGVSGSLETIKDDVHQIEQDFRESDRRVHDKLGDLHSAIEKIHGIVLNLFREAPRPQKLE